MLSGLALTSSTNGLLTEAALQAWYTQTNTFQANGASAGVNVGVNWWKDKWNTYHLTNANTAGSVWPTNRASGADGSNYVIWHMDGSGFSPAPFTNAIVGGSNYSIYAVCQLFSTALFNTTAWHEWITDIGGLSTSVLDWKASITALGPSATFGPSTIPLNTWMTIAVIVSVPSSVIIYTNNVQYVSDSLSVAKMQNFGLGVPGGIGCSMAYEDLLIYTNHLTLNQLTNNQTYFHGKFPTSIPAP